MQRRDKTIAVLIGIFGGFIVGLTSVGSGTFFGLVMMIAFPLTAAKIVGTDLFQAALLLWVAGFGHFVTGSVDLGATGWLLIGSIPGVLIGSQLTVKLPDRSLRVTLALVLSLSGIKLLDPPGANAIILTVVAVALVVGISSRDQELHPPWDRGGVGGGSRGGEQAGAVVSWQPELPVVRVRWARPTDKLDEVVTFYRDGLGLKELGHFEGHSGYDGVMLGLPGSDYHLEFTSHADGSPCPAPSIDNLLVLYLESEQAAAIVAGRLSDLGYPDVEPENPYWDGRSITVADPDGWRVVLDWGLAEE